MTTVGLTDRAQRAQTATMRHLLGALALSGLLVACGGDSAEDTTLLATFER